MSETMARTSRPVVVRARKARRRVQALRAPVWPKRCRRTGCEDVDFSFFSSREPVRVVVMASRSGLPARQELRSRRTLELG